MKTFTDTSNVAEYIRAASSDHTPFIVAVDGYGGSGKSTLCRQLIELLPDCGTVQIDDFIVHPHEPNVFNHDWDSIEQQVLQRLNKDPQVITKNYDWNTLAPTSEHTQSVQNVMLIDGIGLLDPKYAAYFDLKIWVDCPFELSLERGKRRDKEHGTDHDELWDSVWGPGEKRYFERVRPDLLADILFKTH